MRICVVSPQFHPMLGGYERQVRLLAAEWVRRGHEVTVIAERRGPWPTREVLDGIRIVRHPLLMRRGLHGPTSAIGRSVLLACRRFDALLVNCAPRGCDLAVLAMKTGRQRCVMLWRLPITDARDPSVAMPARMRRSIRSWMRQRNARFVVMSDSMRQDLVASGARAECVVCVPNGVQLELAHRRRDPESLRLLFVGRLSEQKAPLLAVDVLAAIQARGLRATLTIVGGGPLRDAILVRAMERGIRGALTMMGAVEAGPLYFTADVILQTSIYEGMSNVLLEAMAHGLPFVTTASSGASDILAAAGTNPPGLLVETREPRVLAERICEHFFDAATCTAMGNAGRELVRERYSIERAASSYLRAFGFDA